MREHQKPVRKCHGCALNLGNHCWLYAYPRGQWRNGRTCRAHGEPRFEAALEQWRKRPEIKTRKMLRREGCGGRRGGGRRAGGEGADWARESGMW